MTKEFIEGIVIGSINKISSNIKMRNGTKLCVWKDCSETYELTIGYQCRLYLSELKNMEAMVNDFCSVRYITISFDGYITIVIDKSSVDV